MRNRLASHWLSLTVFIGLIAVIQLIGNIVTIPHIGNWYAALNKPFWTPPNWLFGPVWTVLYIMIAVSGWLLWISLSGNPREKIKNKAFMLYGIQLILNFIWSPLFFYYHLTAIALIDILLLALCIVFTIRAIHRFHQIASYLLVPYLLWVLYASTLNAGIVYLN